MASAGGKVILVGEHAVVYGVEAIAAGLVRGAQASARRGATQLRIAGKLQPDDSPNLDALRSLASSLELEPGEVDVALDMPAGVGLGASAAMAVAIARAICESQGETPDNQRILPAANAWERVFHGSPSGIDAACSAYGGCIGYSRSNGVRQLTLNAPLTLAVAVAGPASATHEMVARVADLRRAQPQSFEQALQRIAALSQRAERCIASGQLEELGAIFDENHAQLAAWQLATPSIEAACLAARRAGALGAKVTGAGGGGCVLALPRPNDAGAVIQSWRELGYECFVAEVKPGTL